MSVRGKWQGMLTIARFNWPFYLAATAMLIASLAALISIRPLEWRIVCGVAFAGSVYFLFVSLGVSHLIYDCSDLYRFEWLDRALRGAARGQFLFCHSGFDESSELLREKLSKDAGWQVLDHFDESLMTEASIRRARRLFPPVSGTLPADYNRWPVEAPPADVIIGLLAIHELRSEAERSAWFSEAKRCLRAGGRVLLVEHVRDLANFLAFGPGFLHFHSPASWGRAWEHAGFRSIDEFRITPWVRVFVLITP